MSSLRLIGHPSLRHCCLLQVDAVILDQNFFVETDGWSVAQSLKLIKANLCVLLVSRAQRLHGSLPKGVDAIVSQQNPQQAIAALVHILGLEDPAAAGQLW